ncbi:MAG TPA: hypothetical protein PLD62_04890, partial [Candidatus Cloacimonadota bacterium]|nr:hypothetical protein [Candidatus Cloacimonadota bacterium]
MFKVFCNQKGNAYILVIALIMTLVSAVSAWSLIGLVSDAELQSYLYQDAIQEELFLRSESTRMHLTVELNNSTMLILPDRDNQDMTIVRSDDIYFEQIPVTKYKIENKSKYTDVTVFMGITTQKALQIKSLITATHKFREFRKFVSPVKRMTEKLVQNKSLAQYQYFTDVEASENSENGNDVVRFYGADVLDGPVFSNDDIWIRNIGGWPTFNAEVKTHGFALVYPGGERAIYASPWESIFLGGLVEEAPEEIFEPDASELQANAVQIGNGVDIVSVKMEGSSMQTMYGFIVEEGTQDFDVYSWYPDRTAIANNVTNNGGNWYEDADNIWTNEITIYDTIWQPGPVLSTSNAGRAYYVPDGELWISGAVSGKLTWGCANRIYITGDITYSGTTLGTRPDLTTNPNTSDYFGLVSEERIIIQYKNHDPHDSNYSLNDDNCDDIYLYGAYAAIGDGEVSLYGPFNCHYEGI